MSTLRFECSSCGGHYALGQCGQCSMRGIVSRCSCHGYRSTVTIFRGPKGLLCQHHIKPGPSRQGA